MDRATHPTDLSPWHPGETAMQQHAGVDGRMAALGRRIFRDHLDAQHRAFYPQLPFVVAGAVDERGDAWATLLAGRPGFLAPESDTALRVAAPRDPGDPADAGMEDGDAIALLGIELDTRRRNRLNGLVRRDGPDGFTVAVGQAFGNCPQYIQLRTPAFIREPGARPTATRVVTDRLDTAAVAMIRAADTFFVASYVDREGGARQVDVSHRGGRPGFVRIDDDGGLTIPDFAGNLYFNTLGNLLANPRAGLLFVDFATGDTLQLSGDAEVILESPEIAAFQGAERLWRFRPRRVVRRADATPLRWTTEADAWSPNTLMTGDWDQAAARLRAAELGRQWRPFRVRRIVDETAQIRSFHLEPADGHGAVAPEAGQHLPIRVQLDGEPRPTLRTYTLSSAPSDPGYRISVRRDGRVSSHLHDRVSVGDLVEARAPAGGFVVDATERRPAIFLAAGVGVTPMVAMLRHIVHEGLRTRRIRPSVLFYGVRTVRDFAFDAELRALERQAQGALRVVRVVSDPTDGRLGRDFDAIGRIDRDLLRRLLRTDLDADWQLCGPPAFMQALYDALRADGIPDARLHAEAFGPGSFVRDAVAGEGPEPATGPVEVTFALAGKVAPWTPEAGSLLELAEGAGLTPEASCRSGSCGTCRTRVLEGAVAYAVPPTAVVDADEALICCARPAAGGARLRLDL